MNIVLSGFMGSGKTTVAKIMSEKLDIPYVDIDDYVEEQENMPISDIFTLSGEPYFRQLEKNAVKTLSQKDDIIIATGGGTILENENAALLKKNGKIIFLDVTIDTILQRTEGNNKRPLLQKRSRKEIAELLMGRLPVYTASADFTVDTNEKSLEEVADEIIQKISLDKLKL